MTRRPALLLAVVVAAVPAAAAADQDPTTEARSAVLAYFKAVQKREWRAACSLLSQRARKPYGGTIAACARKFRSTRPRLGRVEIAGAALLRNGRAAAVSVIVGGRRETITLVKVRGRFKLDH